MAFVVALPACPADTQCQSGEPMNITASNHEWHAMLSQEMPAVQCDIKQIQVLAVRLFSLFFKMPDMQTSQRCNRVRKRARVRPLVCRRDKEKTKRRRSLKRQDRVRKEKRGDIQGKRRSVAMKIAHVEGARSRAGVDAGQHLARRARRVLNRFASAVARSCASTLSCGYRQVRGDSRFPRLRHSPLFLRKGRILRCESVIPSEPAAEEAAHRARPTLLSKDTGERERRHGCSRHGRAVERAGGIAWLAERRRRGRKLDIVWTQSTPERRLRFTAATHDGAGCRRDHSPRLDRDRKSTRLNSSHWE